jgi:hypothetical protein
MSRLKSTFGSAADSGTDNRRIRIRYDFCTGALLCEVIVHRLRDGESGDDELPVSSAGT